MRTAVVSPFSFRATHIWLRRVTYELLKDLT